MEKFIKLFPLLPKKDDLTAAILETLLYCFAPQVVAWFVAFILSLTIILIPVAWLVCFLSFPYSIVGVIFVWMSFAGKDFINK